MAAGVTDPDEYLEIAKKIGYENLESSQRQYVTQLEHHFRVTIRQALWRFQLRFCSATKNSAGRL